MGMPRFSFLLGAERNAPGATRRRRSAGADGDVLLQAVCACCGIPQPDVGESNGILGPTMQRGLGIGQRQGQRIGSFGSPNRNKQPSIDPLRGSGRKTPQLDGQLGRQPCPRGLMTSDDLDATRIVGWCIAAISQAQLASTTAL